MTWLSQQVEHGKLFKIGSAVRSLGVIEPRPRHIEKTAADGGRLILSHEYLGNKPIDISWLPFAAESYEISNNPRDYVLVPIPIVTVGVPNRNMDCFPFREASKWNYLTGKITYQTFIGKPTCKDHDNQDPRRARGVHFDASLHRWDRNPNFWKVTVLGAFDRTKDEQMVRDILAKKRTGYSMGGLVDRTFCSVCNSISSGQYKCACMTNVGKGGIIHGSLVYDICEGINWIESSSLGNDPADNYAYSDVQF